MSNTHKHIPLRMCIICRKKYPKQQLRRYVVTADGIYVDASGKQRGRGAYVCDDLACQQRTTTGDGLGKALRVRVTDADRQRIIQNPS